MAAASGDMIPKKEKILYGMGELYGGGSATLISLVLLVFLNKALGISTAIAGTIIMVSKVWDAVSDPLMGVISDNTRSRFGRRRPYIVLGGLLTVIAMLLLFAPIAGAAMWFKIAFAAFSYLFFCTANTVSQVPYCSLSSDISPDFKERNKANSMKLVFSMVSAAFCYLVPSVVLEGYLAGTLSTTAFYLIIGLGFGLYFAVPLILAGIFTKERVPYNINEKCRFRFTAYKKPFKVKSFIWHIVMYVCVFLCMDIISALAVYYATDVMRGATVFGMKMSSLFIIAPMMLMIFIMIPIILKLAKKKSKQFALRVGLPCYVAGGLVLAFLPSSSNGIFVVVAAAVMGVGFAGAQSMPWLIFPDTVDVAQLKYGKRDTGSFSGIMTFLRKLSTAIAIWLVGIILELAGQIPGIEGQPQPIQPASVLLTTRILLGVSIVILITTAFIASLKYRVTDKKLERVRFYNDAETEGRELTEEETAEKDALLKELA